MGTKKHETIITIHNEFTQYRVEPVIVGYDMLLPISGSATPNGTHAGNLSVVGSMRYHVLF